MKMSAYCLTHKKVCKLKTARRHFAGSICKAYSRRGTGQRQAHPTVIPLIAWLGLRRLVQEADVTHEIVNDGTLGILKTFLGDMYFFDMGDIDSVSCGIRAGHLQSFVKMRHKCKVLECTSPLNDFAKRFVRACSYDLMSHFFMTGTHACKDGVMQNEAWEVLKWAQTRPSSKEYGSDHQLEPIDDDAYYRVLTETEKLEFLTGGASNPTLTISSFRNAQREMCAQEGSSPFKQ